MPENTPTSPDPQFRPERSSDRGRVRALSPSRIKDYIQCPRLFFYKSILGIPTPPSMATLRGTLAHHAFERVFDHPVGSRSVDVALSYVEPAWRMTLDPLVDRATVEPGSAEDVLRRLEGRYRDEHEPGSESESRLLEAAVQARMVVAGHDEEAFINTVRDAVANWYVMENPDKFTPTERERYVRAQVGKVTVHGYIDRLDVIASSSGVERTYVSDYKGLALDTPLPTP